MTGRRAFTLIELLIVVAIIGVLAAIAVPNFLNAQMRARIAKVQSDHKSLGTALEMYLLENNSYPGDHDLDNYMNQECGLFKLTTPISYMSALPHDPFVNRKMRLYISQTGNAYAAEGRDDYEMGSGSDNQGANRKHAYSLMSYGPDLLDDNSSHDPFPFFTDMDRYDATNGLKSSGNIFTFGGDYMSGCIVLDWGKDRMGSACN
ncbi:MAG: prepilin-type N-terminal cleavage/methylation domain-containing protein [Candidatus Omnitrophota bacterium]